MAKISIAIGAFTLGFIHLALLSGRSLWRRLIIPAAPLGGISATMPADKSAALRQAVGYSGEGG